MKISVENLLNTARIKGVKISCAESCTGGLIGSALTEISGSSDVFNGSAVTYSNESKKKILGVKDSTLEKFGAVSEQCAVEMSKGALRIYDSDFAVSVTGIAGPEGGSELKPVGTVWFAFSSKDKTESILKNFSGTRSEIRESARDFALSELLRIINQS